MVRPTSNRSKKSSGPINNELSSLQLLQEIEQRQFRAAYLFYGSERYLIDEMVSALRKALVDQEASGFDYDLLDGENSTPSIVVNCANTPPWLLERRLVLVKNVPWFRGIKKTKATRGGVPDPLTETTEIDEQTGETENEDTALSPDLLLEYLKKPNPSTVVVMLAHDEVDRRRKLFRTLTANGIAIECREMNDRERRIWMKRKASAMGLDIEPAALDYLIAFGGKSLYGLANELEKLSLFFNQEQARVSVETVQVLCPRNVEERIFDIMQAVTEKQTGLALSRIRELTRSGIQPQRIFYLLVRHFRIMLKAKGLIGQSYTDQELASLLQVDYRIASKYLREARELSEIKLVKGLKWMLEMDVALKTGQGNPEIGLEVLIAQISLEK